MKKIVVLLASLIVISGLLAGCAQPTPTAAPTQAPVATEAPTAEPTAMPTPQPIIVTDALGRTVEFAELPQRIVLAGKATTMLTGAFYLFPEALERVVSYENRSQSSLNFIKTVFPTTESLTLLEKNASAEQIAPLNPDLVVMKTYMKKNLGDSLETIGIKVIYLDLETPEKFYADLMTIGLVLGNPDRSVELVNLYNEKDTAIKSAAAGIADADKPNVLVLEQSVDGDAVTFAVPPMDWLQTIMVQSAGGNPVWKETVTDGGWTMVTLEQIAAWNPDQIFIVNYSGKAKDIVESLKADANWQLLDAVKNEQLFAFPADFFSYDQPDPRWILGEQWLASRINPALFPSFNLVDEVKAFYQNFYGLDEAAIQEKILPLLSGDY